MSFLSRFVGAIAAGITLLVLAPPAHAAAISVAVAANFTDAAKGTAAAWEKKTGHKAILSFGATGQLFAQIHQGAPFDVFLSADEATATKMGTDGLAVPATQFTYAVGRLVLFSKAKDAVRGEQTLRDGNFAKLAIANPAVAPYGRAAIDTMKALGIYEKLTPKIVEGQNVVQTYQFVDTGNAEVGFIALSQIAGHSEGSRWVVPGNLYAPIRQDAILLTKAAGNAAARDFIAFLNGPEAMQVKAKYGYGSLE
ncbi:MAG: molybdate ABC transporter substrate-binding protein [Alphaproteobacteria bacterium]|nr:molybdate ABC transporter substrate-binding protein [Alphaproteobacteria bacterium]